MGTYVNVTGSSSSGRPPPTGIRHGDDHQSQHPYRTSANGSKSGYVLSKGSKVTLLATPTTAGGIRGTISKPPAG
jgi:hypothetical protein